MKKTGLFFSSILLFTIFVVSNAQTPTFEKGNGVASLTIGLGNALYSSGATSSVPPISASYEVGVVENVFDRGVIGVGGYVGYTSATWEYNFLGSWSWKSTDLIIGVRGALHYPFVDNLDTYAGLMLAYNINTWKETGTVSTGYTRDSYGGIILPGFVGARYYFNEKFAGVAELGWGIAYLNIGIAVKLK